jgi:mono/diheme cytochrome c family protein
MGRTRSVFLTMSVLFSLCAAQPAFATDEAPDEEAGSTTPLRLELGGNDYQTYCASCHGESGRGDGPVAEFLALTPADLTKLARKNGGTFPAARIAQIIDGRQEVKVHGPRDMPVWGDWFDAEAEAPGLRASEREIVVRERIDALVTYLETIQVK